MKTQLTGDQIKTNLVDNSDIKVLLEVKFETIELEKDELFFVVPTIKTLDISYDGDKLDYTYDGINSKVEGAASLGYVAIGVDYIDIEFEEGSFVINNANVIFKVI